jgi:hypothetical protein
VLALQGREAVVGEHVVLRRVGERTSELLPGRSSSNGGELLPTRSRAPRLGQHCRRQLWRVPPRGTPLPTPSRQMSPRARPGRLLGEV